MMREAESHADEDKKRKEEIETRNQADQAVYAAERMLKEAGDKLPAADRQPIEVGDRGAEEGDREERRRRDEARAGRAATRRSTRPPRRCTRRRAVRCRVPARAPASRARAPRGGGSRDSGDVIDAEVVEEEKK